MTLTVIVPLYNGARFLHETLDSLAGQSLALDEVIVVDDGSTDDGTDIAAAHPVAPRLIRQERAGVACARNRGAVAARTPYIAFLDQDDIWLPDRHRNLAAYLETEPTPVVVTTERAFVLENDVATLSGMGQRIHLEAMRVADSKEAVAQASAALAPTRFVRPIGVDELLRGTVTVTTSYVFDREAFLVAGGCMTLARSSDDLWALLALARLAPLAYLEEPSVLYRIHPGSTSMTTAWARSLLTQRVAALHGGNVAPADGGRFEDHSFFEHWLFELAGDGLGGLRDALAISRLTRPSSRMRMRLLRRALRSALRG